LGGNLVLKMAGELGCNAPSELRGICAVCPSIDPAAAAEAICQPHNALYERYFLMSYRRLLERKARLFPERYNIETLDQIEGLREWDEAITAPVGGYLNAADCYYQTSAKRVVTGIRVPTLIIAAQDDPIIPFASFCDSGILDNPFISLIATQCGGHCGFVSRYAGDERFWAESRIVDFCRQQLQMTCDSPMKMPETLRGRSRRQSATSMERTVGAC
jgi:uncharacterized protein